MFEQLSKNDIKKNVISWEHLQNVDFIRFPKKTALRRLSYTTLRLFS